MILFLVAFSIGLATCWFALEGLRQRVRHLEAAFTDRTESPAPQAIRSSEREPLAPVVAEAKSDAIPGMFEPEIGRTQPEVGLLRRLIGEDEWEKVIGGSWLNKLGVLVFVIGVGLLLRYSFGDMGAVGHVCVGLAISISMILGGVIMEGRRDYPIYYGRGLIGGGWAALYFTTYAAYGIASARVIENPLLATALLLAVASAMIVHSLRYRSEVVTGLAYFVAFATLVLTPMTLFAVIASLPLAVSLLFLAQRFEWKRMAVAGLIVTYGAYVFSVAGRAPSSPGDQIVLLIYWLIFEVFDLASFARNKRPQGEQNLSAVVLFPLNACGYVGASLLRWDASIPVDLFLAGSALLFLGDTVLRAWIRPPARPSDREMTLTGIASGYEASLITTAALATAAILERFTGLRLEVALLLEAEMLIIVGVQLGLAFPSLLGSVIMLLPLSRIVAVDFFDPGTIMLAVFVVRKWSFVALLGSGALYLDRWLVKERWNVLFGYAAAVLLALVIEVQVAAGYEGLAWLVLGMVLFQAGLALRAVDLRLQGYGAVGLGVASLLLTSLTGSEVSRVALGLGALLVFTLAFQVSPIDGAIPKAESEPVRRIALAAGTALVVTLLWCELPASAVAVGWSLFAIGLMVVGVRWSQRDFRVQSYAIAILAFARCGLVNLDITTSLHGIPEGIVTSAFVVAALYSLSLIKLPQNGPRPEVADPDLQRALEWLDWRSPAVFAVLAIVLLTALLYNRVEASALTEAWAFEGLPLVIIGFLRRDRLSRLSGLMLLAICVLKIFFYDLGNLDTLARIFSFMILGLLLLGVSLIYARFYERLRPYFSRPR